MTTPTDTRGLVLDEYTKACPPGWKPHVASYPLRVYLEKVQLWLNMTDIAAHQLGASLVGRLKEAAYRLALKTRITTQSGQVLHGIDVVVFIGEDAMTDVAGIHYPAVPSGVQK